MDNNTQNLILAVVLSMLILVIYQIYLAPPLPDPSESGYSGQTTESLAPPAEVQGSLRKPKMMKLSQRLVCRLALRK